MKLITDTTMQYLEPKLRIEVRQVDRIIRKGSGKLKHFHSLIKKPGETGLSL